MLSQILISHALDALRSILKKDATYHLLRELWVLLVQVIFEHSQLDTIGSLEEMTEMTNLLHRETWWAEK